MPDIFGVLEFPRNREGRGKVRRPQFRDQFFGGIRFIPESARKITIQAAFVSRPITIVLIYSFNLIGFSSIFTAFFIGFAVFDVSLPLFHVRYLFFVSFSWSCFEVLRTNAHGSLSETITNDLLLERQTGVAPGVKSGADGSGRPLRYSQAASGRRDRGVHGLLLRRAFRRKGYRHPARRGYTRAHGLGGGTERGEGGNDRVGVDERGDPVGHVEGGGLTGQPVIAQRPQYYRQVAEQGSGLVHKPGQGPA